MTYIWTPSLTLLFIKLLPWNLEFSYKFARWIKHWHFADLHFERVTYFLYLSYFFFIFTVTGTSILVLNLTWNDLHFDKLPYLQWLKKGTIATSCIFEFNFCCWNINFGPGNLLPHFKCICAQTLLAITMKKTFKHLS